MSAGASLLPISGLQCLIKFIRVEMRSACPHPCLPDEGIESDSQSEQWRSSEGSSQQDKSEGAVARSVIPRLVGQKVWRCSAGFHDRPEDRCLLRELRDVSGDRISERKDQTALGSGWGLYRSFRSTKKPVSTKKEDAMLGSASTFDTQIPQESRTPCPTAATCTN